MRLKLFLFLLLAPLPLFGNSYSTTFPATENPISESGKWVNGGTTGLDWTNILTTTNVAFGSSTGSGSGFDDSSAVLQNAGTWGRNQSVTTIVKISSRSNSFFPEVEIRLNTTIAAHSITGYECNYSTLSNGSQYSSIVRWNGAFGSFTQLSTRSAVTQINNGDVFTCSNIGGTISSYLNGVLIQSTTDSTYTAGSPGIGTDLDGTGCGCNGQFGFSSFMATDGLSGGACPVGSNYLTTPHSETLGTLSTMGVTSCFYVSKTLGSDSNTGISEASPWAHMPGMPSCSSVCASVSPAAGLGFIMRGGDSWLATDLNVDWSPYSGGTSGNPVYIGVDTTWFNSGVCTGATFCRPIWNCGGTACSQTTNGGAFFVDSGSEQHVFLDDIEMTGLFMSNSATPDYIIHFGSNETASRIYAHGWSHVASVNSNSSSFYSTSTCCGGGTGNVLRDSIADGTDTTQDMMVCMGGVYEAYNNVCKLTTDGLTGGGTNLHDNWIGPLVLCAAVGGCHQNAIQLQAPIGSTALIYNNVITQVPSGGMGQLWIMQASPSATAYVFNNVEFNTAVGNNVNVCQLAGTCGPIWIFNNTFQCGNNSTTGDCMGGTSGATQTVHWINNHCITSTVCVSASWSGLTVSYGTSDPFQQTVATASSQGYTSGSTYAFQPTNRTGGTVGAGVNEQALCTTIAGINAAAGAACQSDTTYAGSYNATSHTISFPARTVVARPATAAFDIGAFQQGNTYYVDPVNGSTRYDAVKNTGGHCNGTGTAAWVSGTNQACPFNDMESTWNIIGVFADSAYVMQPGDTLRIKNCTLATGNACKMAGDDNASSAAFHLWGIGTTGAPPPLPNNVTIVSDTCSSGCGVTTQAYNSTSSLYQFQALDPTKAAYIWGGNGAFFVLSLAGTSGATLSGLDISDHSNCGSTASPSPGGSSPSCSGTEYTTYGLYFGTSGPSNLTLTDIKIHGMQAKGIIGPIGTGTLTATRLWIAGNGQTGWDFDDGSGDPSTGSVVGSNVAIQFNGCSEEYPIVDAVPFSNCLGQSNGGQGDGVGTPVTPLSVSFDHCNAIYNTQDGFDIGHAYGGTTSFTNCFFYGNNGGNIKVGPMQTVNVYNNIIISGCNRMSAAMTGNPYFPNANLGDFCRANTANGVNVQANSNFLFNGANSGTATMTCPSTTCTSSNGISGLANGQHVMPLNGTVAGDLRTVSGLSGSTFTISSAFTTGVSGNALMIVPATPASTTVVHWYHNTTVHYPSGLDNQVQIADNRGQSQSLSLDIALAPGYVWDFRDNINVGYFDNNYNPGAGNHNPTVFPELQPTIEDYNVWSGMNTAPTGGNDLTSVPPLIGRPATPMSIENVLDNFNMNLSSDVAGTAISGQTNDLLGNPWTTFTRGAIQFIAAPTVNAVSLGATKSFGAVASH